MSRTRKYSGRIEVQPSSNGYYILRAFDHDGKQIPWGLEVHESGVSCLRTIGGALSLRVAVIDLGADDQTALDILHSAQESTRRQDEYLRKAEELDD